MGSIDKACISGFLCRLCSEMHRVVIHVYGDQGVKLKLVDKINGYLPITISPTDHLPKTICQPCLHRVEQHYDLLLKLKHYGKNRFEINLKKITTPNPDNPDRTSIGVNTEEYDPRPQIRSWLLNSTTYSSDSSMHDSDEFDDYDDEAAAAVATAETQDECEAQNDNSVNDRNEENPDTNNEDVNGRNAINPYPINEVIISAEDTSSSSESDDNCIEIIENEEALRSLP